MGRRTPSLGASRDPTAVLRVWHSLSVLELIEEKYYVSKGTVWKGNPPFYEHV